MAKPLSSQMKRAKEEQLRQKEEARKNTTISKKVGREEPIVVKSGTPIDHSSKHEPYVGAKFGMSKGVTKNMENYESLRVDVWLTGEVMDGESPQEAFARIEGIIDSTLEEAVYATMGE